jgi:hypothetical protein
VVFGRVSKVTRTGIEGGPEEGDLFTFRFKADKDKLTVSDVTATRGGEEAKRLAEGDYDKK